MSGPAKATSSRTALVHPAYDVLLIGGGLSLLAFLAIAASGVTLLGGSDPMGRLALVVFMANSAHFAASTVRLYTKRDSFDEHPFLTMALPLVCLASLGLCLTFPEQLGRHLWALYLTWSPFHYSAQAFGIASLYCRRSGSPLAVPARRWLRVACLLPFFYALLGTGQEMGLGWLLPVEWIASVPGLPKALNTTRSLLAVASFALPLILFAILFRGGRAAPFISLLTVIANAVWWTAFPYYEAFAWATVFHGIQYLALVVVFYARERVASEQEARSPVFYALWFYALSLVLAYGLFQLAPYAARTLGFGWAESLMLVVAMINVHHFIVDAYIWRFRPSDSNRSVIEVDTKAGTAASLPASA